MFKQSFQTFNLKAVTTATTTNGEGMIAAATSGGAVTITLSAADTGRAGQAIIIKDGGGTAATANITITPPSGVKIDGATGNKVISTNYGVLRLVSNGTDWLTW